MANDKRRSNSELERQQIINFFEELSWLLDANKDINYRNVSKFLKECRNLYVHGTIVNNNNNEAYSLIGVLPSLLKDNELFQSNAQLVQFAEEVLKLNISRWEKRSRNEIIGLIICEVEDANKEHIDVLTQWVSNILENKKKVKDLQSKAQISGNLFSWNETIQKLVSEENE